MLSSQFMTSNFFHFKVLLPWRLSYPAIYDIFFYIISILTVSSVESIVIFNWLLQKIGSWQNFSQSAGLTSKSNENNHQTRSIDLILPNKNKGLTWSWLYGSWIYNYLCNQCLSPLTLWVWTSLRWGVLDTTLCDKVCQWFAAGQWFLWVLQFPPPIKLTATI